MVLPISEGHPLGIANPATIRVAAALAGAGAWDAAPLEFACAGFRSLTLYMAYTRGAANGAFDYEIYYSPYSADLVAPAVSWFSMTIYDAGALAAGTLVQSRIQSEYITYQAVTGNPEGIVTSAFNLVEGAERIRIPCRESGALANPGTLQIIGYFNI